MDIKLDFTGKVTLITGAASGMGFLFCQKFVEAGGCAAMVDVNQEAVEAAAEKLNAIRPSSAKAIVCDVRDYKQVCRARDEAVAAFGRIDVLIPFAGGAEIRMLKVDMSNKEFPDVPIEVYDWGLDVNLKGQFYFDHAVLAQMREQKSGVIIHVGSITGEEGCIDAIAYSTAKSAAMNGLTKSIGQYGAKYGVRCCCISPGPVLTREAMAKLPTLMGRAAEPEEIVDMAMYIASDKGAFFTGVNFLMDGGRNILAKVGYKK